MKLYHRISKHFVGDEIVSLYDLKTLYPELYELHVFKYEGRFEIMKRMLSYINCLWNDVIHLSPLHPSFVYKALNDVGYNKSKKYFTSFEIDSDVLDKENLIIYKYSQDVFEKVNIPMSDFFIYNEILLLILFYIMKS